MLPPGYRLLALGRVGSTSSEAMRRAHAGEPAGLWVTADEQVRGRGRSGRVWTSVPGNLYASLLLRLTCPPVVAQQLALVAGVAVAEAVAEVSVQRSDTVPPPRLKWPNDVMIGEAKVGGILVESATGVEGLTAVVGIGLNVVGVPDGLARAATSLAAAGIATDRRAVLEALAAAMDSALTMWDEGRGFAGITAAWQARAGAIGERLVVNAGAGPVSGYYAGLGHDGALLLSDEQGVVRRFTYGDVTIAARDGGNQD
jgi:BirA family biotin operon repressor/biotin-[acetyl-CoA-carboxylase] ligase